MEIFTHLCPQRTAADVQFESADRVTRREPKYCRAFTECLSQVVRVATPTRAPVSGGALSQPSGNATASLRSELRVSRRTDLATCVPATAGSRRRRPLTMSAPSADGRCAHGPDSATRGLYAATRISDTRPAPGPAVRGSQRDHPPVEPQPRSGLLRPTVQQGRHI